MSTISMRLISEQMGFFSLLRRRSAGSRPTANRTRGRGAATEKSVWIQSAYFSLVDKQSLLFTKYAGVASGWHAMFTLLKGWEVLAGSLLREGGDDDEREDVQKKTFAKWINSQLNGKPLVSDLFSDLRDGEVLLSLLEILTAQQYIRFRLKLFRKCSGCDACAGLVWSIILHWQVQYHLKDLMTELQQTSLERTLLAWCRAHTQGYAGVDVVNFTWSWADGLALNALLHRWRPALFAWEALAARAPRDRLDHAFALAHDYLGIDRLLDPEGTRPPLACDCDRDRDSLADH
ncbi:hypothetical protein MSG28_007806 [Choristoneura fumiferana]|uniref:Uncharacterized protein n=1 Tax=Choristoneura fumiferana TaxID=7141 RepID=A0ACC0JYZ7_CHOFU|nr:hypothetical protein MSG28_007806 [Choristoneura fumiferana]